MNLLSGVRLGVGLNLISTLSVYTLNKLLIFTQPAHLAGTGGSEAGDPELAELRANRVRGLLEDDASRLKRPRRTSARRPRARGPIHHSSVHPIDRRGTGEALAGAHRP